MRSGSGYEVKGTYLGKNGVQVTNLGGSGGNEEKPGKLSAVKQIPRRSLEGKEARTREEKNVTERNEI